MGCRGAAASKVMIAHCPASRRRKAGARRRRIFWSSLATIGLVLSTVFGAPAAHAGEADAFDAVTGFRISRYRAPVSEPPEGVRRISIDGLDDLVTRHGALLVDVTPAEGGSVDPVTGRWRLLRQRENIPGSTWLPEVGRGVLDADMDAYLRRELERMTAGDRMRPIIVYCQSDCWMAWNALKRATDLGYRRLYWYPEGVDGWRDHDRAFAPAVPVPVGSR